MPTCSSITDLLVAEPDGVLSPVELARIEEHLALCEACRRQRAHLKMLPARMRDATEAFSSPDIEQEWREVRRRIQSSNPAGEASFAWRRSLTWGLPIAAAAVLTLAAVYRPLPDPGTSVPITARAEFVQSEGSGSTLVYVDQESGWLIVWADAAPVDRAG